MTPFRVVAGFLLEDATEGGAVVAAGALAVGSVPLTRATGAGALLVGAAALICAAGATAAAGSLGPPRAAARSNSTASLFSLAKMWYGERLASRISILVRLCPSARARLVTRTDSTSGEATLILAGTLVASVSGMSMTKVSGSGL